MSQGLRLLQHDLRQVKLQNSKLNTSILELQTRLEAASNRATKLETRLAALETPIDVQQPGGASAPKPKRRPRKKRAAPVVTPEVPKEQED